MDGDGDGGVCETKDETKGIRVSTNHQEFLNKGRWWREGRRKARHSGCKMSVTLGMINHLICRHRVAGKK